MEIFDEDESFALAKKKYYIKPEQFRKAYEESENLGKPTQTLIDYFEKIGKRYSTKYNNLAQIDVDGCVNYALMEAITKWQKYDRTRSTNLFAFFTEVIKHDLTIHYNYLKKNSRRNISLDVIYQESKK